MLLKHTRTHAHLNPYLPIQSRQHHHTKPQRQVVTEVVRKRFEYYGCVGLEII